MNRSERQFLRRHLPGWVEMAGRTAKANEVLAGDTLAVRTDGMAFYIPTAAPGEVWVAWLTNGPTLKTSPETRRLCSLEEYDAELEARLVESSKLFGEEAS